MSLRPRYDGGCAGDPDLLALEQFDAPERRACHQPWPFLHQAAHIVRMKPIDILGRIERIKHALLRVGAHRLRQR